MPTPPIQASERYFRPGVTKVYFVPTLADYNNPTRTEMDAGTDLSPEIASIEGFTVTSGTIDTPDLASRFTSKIPARITADDSALNLYADKTDADVRTLLPRDTTGFVLFLDGGDVPTQLMDVYPVTVASAPKLRDLENAAQIRVQFTITREPAENVAIPATV